MVFCGFKLLISDIKICLAPDRFSGLRMSDCNHPCLLYMDQCKFSFFQVSILQLHMLLSEHENIPWEALSYLIGGVSYGGRVTDEWDRRCLHALLDRFFCPEALQPDYSFSPDKVLYLYYSKTCLKRPLKKETKIGFNDQLLLTAGQKYCRMLQEHSAILSTFIKQPFVIKTFVLSIFDWPLKAGFTVYTKQ